MENLSFVADGGLIVKILRRNASFQELDKFQGLAIGHNTKLNVPKKTKLFIDQTQRERDNAVCKSIQLIGKHSI